MPGYRTATKLLTGVLFAVFFSLPTVAADSSLYNFEDGLNELVLKLSRSIVTVEASNPSAWSEVVGVDNSQVYDLVSTGVIYDSIGHILASAASVVGRSRVMIKFEGEVVPAVVTALDYQRGLALLKSAWPVGEPVEISREYGCAGQMLVALGGAYSLRVSPSLGFCGGARPDGVIQFSAPITSGTVGGGLFNFSGQLVGIITGSMGQGDQMDMGLAVPAQEAGAIANYLMTRGDRAAGFVGLTSADIEISPGIEVTFPNRLINNSGGRDTIERGVVVTRVVDSSPAGKAGLRTGDLLFSLNGRRIVSAYELADIIRRTEPGTNVELGLVRRNTAMFIPLEVGPKELMPYETASVPITEPQARELLRDSLMTEINSLKQSLNKLEHRLKQLR